MGSTFYFTVPLVVLQENDMSFLTTPRGEPRLDSDFTYSALTKPATPPFSQLGLPKSVKPSSSSIYIIDSIPLETTEVARESSAATAGLGGGASVSASVPSSSSSSSTSSSPAAAAAELGSVSSESHPKKAPEISNDDGDDDAIDVLVVDDSQSNRKMLQMLLKRTGVSSVAAHDGLDALNKIRSNPDKFKLILMDNLMPTMNGIDATKTLRDEGFKQIIVGVTGNVMENDLSEYLDSGADLVLTKPINAQVLKQVVALKKAGFISNFPRMKLKENVTGGDLEWVERDDF
jgi:CheY-like chemotaxis protein